MTIWVGAGVGVVVGFVLAMVGRWIGSRRAAADLPGTAWVPSQQVGAQPAAPRPGVDPQALRWEIEALLRQGRKIQAIKLLREHTEMDLRRAKETVERL